MAGIPMQILSVLNREWLLNVNATALATGQQCMSIISQNSYDILHWFTLSRATSTWHRAHKKHTSYKAQWNTILISRPV